MNSLNQPYSFIFQKMTPPARHKELSQAKPFCSAWMIGESTQDGMLTVSFTFFSKNICITSGNARYALTQNGWITVRNQDVEEVLKIRQYVDRIDASQHVDQLMKLIVSSSLCVEYQDKRYWCRFDIKDRISPNAETETKNPKYINYKELI